VKRLFPIPLALKVPLVVAVLMIVVAAGISKIVLRKIGETQTRHIEQLTGAYLDGLSTALLPPLMRRDAWEAFDALDRARQLYSGVRALDVLAILPDGSVLAAADPIAHPVLSLAPPAARPPARPAGPLEAEAGQAWIHREMKSEGIPVGRIAALIDVSAYIAERHDAELALLIVNSALTLVLAGLGYFFVRRMLAPMNVLSSAFADAQAGHPETIPENRLPRPDTEGGLLLRGYNRMVAAIEERETLRCRLGEEERIAVLGKLASSMAHEVNNPLGGMFNALAMIRRYGDDAARREGAASLIERGLASIRNIVRAALVLWRAGDSGASLTRADIDDLRYIVQAEADLRRVRLDWSVALMADEVPIPAQYVRQIVLNLLLNALAATPQSGVVSFRCEAGNGAVALEVRDEGPGMPNDARARLIEGQTSPPGSGLGLWTVSRIVAMAGGVIEVDVSSGTAVFVRLPFAAGEENDVKSAA
jgi:signal transduction histidine kinase